MEKKRGNNKEDNKEDNKEKISWNEMLRERDRNRKWVEDRVDDLDYPALYFGDEMNTYHFDWDSAVREGRADDTWKVVLVNVIASDFTFSTPAIFLFYDQLHTYYPDWAVERSLCPASTNDQRLMKQDGIRPFAVESKMPIPAFDVLCLSMDLSDSAAAIPWMIMESGLPLYASERGEDDTFVIMGGSALVNPAPFAPFCDILFFGEGEEALPQLLEHTKEGRRRGLSREEILLEAARRWDCIYVPRFYEERYSEDGRFAGTFPLRDDVPARIHFHRVRDLDNIFMISRPFLSFQTSAPGNSHFEISRGCEGKCSFCMAGFTSLPFRARSADVVAANMRKIMYETGNTSVSPVSFNSVSHPGINSIIQNMSADIGEKIRLICLRMDGFRENPELCCFISMMRRGRVLFGVEGASQRLRDLVSKNLTEEQILDAMHEVCRSGFVNVKFMMICNLPTETEADLDELYELAVKIKEIFLKETPTGHDIPRLLISWTALKISPHTPLQWAPANPTLMPAYERFTERIRSLGFSTYTPEIDIDTRICQLSLRGNGHIAPVLAFMAREGYLKHNEPYTEEVYNKVFEFIEQNNLPGIEEQLRGFSYEDPLPWDIVESPASKKYLYRRYLEMLKDKPRSAPICTSSCSGCGACDREYQKQLKAMPALRKEDAKIDLHHIVRKGVPEPVQHVLMSFSYDKLHSHVVPSYWDCEIRRALLHSGIIFDPESVMCFGSDMAMYHALPGPNVTAISLGKRYDLSELKRSIEEHAVNFRIDDLTETERPLRVHTATYRIQLPQGMDDSTAAELLRNRLAEKEWVVKDIESALVFKPVRNIRITVQSLEARDGFLYIVMGPQFTSPRLVYRYIFDIPEDQKLNRIPERTGFTFENKGVLDIALTREKRDEFVRSREGSCDPEIYGALESYIASAICATDLKNLIRRNYRVLETERWEYTRDLIRFTMQVESVNPDEDPALRDLLSILK